MADKPQAVAVIGNLENGFLVVGPFNDNEHAAEWASQQPGDVEVMDLTSPGDAQEAGSEQAAIAAGSVVAIVENEQQLLIRVDQARDLSKRKLIHACDGDCGSGVFHLTPGTQWEAVEKALCEEPPS